jgi:hypothetical protein
MSCVFPLVLYSVWHDRNKWTIPSGKSVNSPILLMMGAVVDDALRRLLSKDESFAAAAGWMSGGGRVGVLVFQWSPERVALSQIDVLGHSKAQCFSSRFFCSRHPAM